MKDSEVILIQYKIQNNSGAKDPWVINTEFINKENSRNSYEKQ